MREVIGDKKVIEMEGWCADHIGVIKRLQDCTSPKLLLILNGNVLELFTMATSTPVTFIYRGNLTYNAGYDTLVLQCSASDIDLIRHVSMAVRQEKYLFLTLKFTNFIFPDAYGDLFAKLGSLKCT